MKKRVFILILTLLIVLSICGCGRVAFNSSKTADIQAAHKKIEEKRQIALERSEQAKEKAQAEEKTISFSDLTYLEFCFSSGAGGWGTYLNIRSDGCFSGEYFDSDMGVTGDGYPNGTMYQCIFNGQFTPPVRINEYTYSMQIKNLQYEKEAGTEEIKNDMRYIYTHVHGLEDAQDILIYLPGAPLTQLPQEFRSWIGYYDLSDTTETELPFYALCNEVSQYGFASYDIVESLRENISNIEEKASYLEDSMADDSLTQAQMDERSAELYDLWDFALNSVWKVLQRTQDEKTMHFLTEEEQEWITMKEDLIDEAGHVFEDDPMQTEVQNLVAAKVTKERVYELMELF